MTDSLPTVDVTPTRKPDMRKPASAHTELPGHPFHSVGQRACLVDQRSGDRHECSVTRFTPKGKFAVTLDAGDTDLEAGLPVNNNALFTQDGVSEYRRLRSAFRLIQVNPETVETDDATKTTKRRKAK